MVNKPKARGTAAESALVAYLQESGQIAERRTLAGAGDKGDINWLPWLTVEVKAVRTPAYPQWLREAEAERVNGSAEIGLVVHKPHGIGLTSQGDWIVAMRLNTLMSLLDKGGLLP